MDDATKLRMVKIILNEIYDYDRSDDASFMFAIFCAILDIINSKEKNTNE